MITYWMTENRRLHTDDTIGRASLQTQRPPVRVCDIGTERVGVIAQAPDGRFLCGRLNRGRAFLSETAAPKLYADLRRAQWGVRRFGRSDRTFTFIPLYRTEETYGDKG